MKNGARNGGSTITKKHLIYKIDTILKKQNKLLILSIGKMFKLKAMMILKKYLVSFVINSFLIVMNS
jgi:hypothetical protein